MRPEGGVKALEALRLYSFGGLDEAARNSRVLAVDPDAGARRIHQAYAGVAARPWETLSEELRVSNRRVLNHLPAKLYSLGFDLEPWLAGPGVGVGLPALAPDEPVFRDRDERQALAELEHRRWMADRRMNGWRYGPIRDDKRKFHPDLVHFDQLPAEVRDLDFAIVDWLIDNMPRAPGGLTRVALS